MYGSGLLSSISWKEGTALLLIEDDAMDCRGLIMGASSAAYNSLVLPVWCISDKLVEGGFRGDGSRSYVTLARSYDFQRILS